MFSPSCPYKTPLLKTLFTKFHQFSNETYNRWNGTGSDDEDDEQAKQVFDEEIGLARSTNLNFDVDVLLGAYDSTKDINVWEMVTRCIDLNSPQNALEAIYQMVERRFGSHLRPWSYLGGCYEQAELRCVLRSMIACIRRAFLITHDKDLGDTLEEAEADALVLLINLEIPLGWEHNSDRALSKMVNILKREALSIPDSYAFKAAYILSFPLAIIPTEVDEVCEY